MGGGGGGSWRIGRSDLNKLEKIAAESVRPAETGGRKNVFLSFESSDLDQINLLRGQAKNERSDLEFNDWSLREPFDSHNAEYIKRGIRERIRQSSVTLVFIGADTHASKWVDWEIRASHEMGKRVVALRSTPNAKLPQAIRDLAVEVVPWSHDALNRAISR